MFCDRMSIELQPFYIRFKFTFFVRELQEHVFFKFSYKTLVIVKKGEISGSFIVKTNYVIRKFIKNYT
jgi:hypothetical protein